MSLLWAIVIPITSQAQDAELPEDIHHFYRNKNFVNTICLKNEKHAVIAWARRNSDLSEIDEERLRTAAMAMRDVVWKILWVEDHMKNPLNFSQRYPYQFEISEFNYMTRWIQTGDKISVHVDTYSFEDEINARYVAAYTPGQTPENYHPMEISDLQFYSKEVHNWVLINGNWYKQAVNLILVDN